MTGWVGWQVGMEGQQVRLIQAKLISKFQWVRQGHPALSVTGRYDEATRAAVAEFQRRAGMPVTGIANWATQKRLGVIQAPPQIRKRLTIFTVAGTGADWMVGYPADIARAMDPAIYQWQPVGYRAATYPMGASVSEGERELVRLIGLPHLPQDFVLVGYSQGAIVTSRTLRRILQGDLRALKPRLKAVVNIGNPMRERGHTFPGGADPGGHGLDPRCLTETPEWVYELAAKGDIYCCASGTDDKQANDNMTAVYKMVMGEGLSAFTGENDIVEQLAEFGLNPLGNSKSMFRAIASGIGFVAGNPPTAPHVEYHLREASPGVTYLQCGIDYLRAVGQRALQAA